VRHNPTLSHVSYDLCHKLALCLVLQKQIKMVIVIGNARLPAVRQRGILELNPAICTPLNHLSLLGVLQSWSWTIANPSLSMTYYLVIVQVFGNQYFIKQHWNLWKRSHRRPRKPAWEVYAPETRLPPHCIGTTIGQVASIFPDNHIPFWSNLVRSFSNKKKCQQSNKPRIRAFYKGKHHKSELVTLIG